MTLTHRDLARALRPLKRKNCSVHKSARSFWMICGLKYTAGRIHNHHFCDMKERERVLGWTRTGALEKSPPPTRLPASPSLHANAPSYGSCQCSRRPFAHRRAETKSRAWQRLRQRSLALGAEPVLHLLLWGVGELRGTDSQPLHISRPPLP